MVALVHASGPGGATINALPPCLTLMRPAVQGHQPEIISERDVADRLEAEGK